MGAANEPKTYRMLSRGIHDEKEIDFCFEVHKKMPLKQVREFFESFMTYLQFKKDKIKRKRKQEALILHATALVLSKDIMEPK